LAGSGTRRAQATTIVRARLEVLQEFAQVVDGFLDVRVQPLLSCAKVSYFFAFRSRKISAFFIWFPA
jgi:hypothetical protein